MPSSLKRKGSPSLEEQDGDSSKRRFAEAEAEGAEQSVAPAATPEEAAAPTHPEQDAPTSASSTLPANDRAARFAALRARNQASRKSNLTETKNEAKRLSTDPSQLTSLTRKKEIAQHKLLKADTEASGEDFERKRAWDWTADESEKWDARLRQKAERRDNNAFQDYAREAGKVYERQIGLLEKGVGGEGMGERRERYEREKREAVDRAVQGGGLEIVETESGELIAVDKDGAFYSTADRTDFTASRPDKQAVDRLVEDIRKAEEIRMKKRRERGRQDDNGEDVTFINEKNKQFNQKLARFYNKYTADIRESFERGTAI